MFAEETVSEFFSFLLFMIGGLLVGMLVKMVSGLSFMRLTFGRDSGLYRCTVVSLICIDQSVRPHIPTPS